MPELPNIGDLIGDKYEVVRVLGQGGMGAVFEGVHRLTGKRFAIKWMLPAISESADAIQRFIREAQVAGRVEHPNVVEVYDLGREDGSCFMVMELLQGESLRELLDRNGKLDHATISQIMLPVLRGLACAHAAGVIHRDLKPENIYLSKNPEGVVVPKVLDFGISKLSSASGQVTVGLTRHGQVMGTPHYMPPEQLRGEKVDRRVDIYAAGVIMYQALAGTLPFGSENFSELVIEIATTSPRPLSKVIAGVPADFCALVERAMARSPESRFNDAAELAAALEPYAAGAAVPFGAVRAMTPSVGFDTVALPGSTPALNETPLAAESTWPDRRPRLGAPWILLASVGVLAVAVIGLLISLLNASEEESWVADGQGEQPAAAASAQAEVSDQHADEAPSRDGLIPLELAGGPHGAPAEVRQRASSLAAQDERAEGVEPEASVAVGSAEPSARSRAVATGASEAARERRRMRALRRKAREAGQTAPATVNQPAVSSKEPDPAPAITTSAPDPSKPKASGRSNQGRTGAQLDVDDF